MKTGKNMAERHRHQWLPIMRYKQNNTYFHRNNHFRSCKYSYFSKKIRISENFQHFLRKSMKQQNPIFFSKSGNLENPGRFRFLEQNWKNLADFVRWGNFYWRYTICNTCEILIYHGHRHQWAND